MSTLYLQQDQEDLAAHCVPLSQEDLWAPCHQALPYHLEHLVGPVKKKEDRQGIYLLLKMTLTSPHILLYLFTELTQDMQRLKSHVGVTPFYSPNLL